MAYSDIKENILKTMWMVIVLCLVYTTSSYSQVNLMYQTNRCGTYAGADLLYYPPIQPDMSWDQALTLVAVDSACRISDIQLFEDSLSQLSDDSLRIAFNAMMNLKRYYPLWIIHLISLQLDSYPAGYLMTYGEVYHAILAEYIERNDTLTTGEIEMLNIPAVFIGEIVELSHAYDSTLHPLPGSIMCYKVSIIDRIVGNHIHPSEGEESDEIVLSVLFYPGFVLPSTAMGYESDKAEFHKLEVGGRYLFLVDVFPDTREADIGHHQVISFPGSFFKITDESITSVFERFGNDGEVVALDDAVQQILSTYNKALGR